ncbi:pol protein [Cucumis melo var. makuwa]|uniref:Pol protein n=1 Tax=Cucumis melo var. makuwa TaxID=1194695 RepID=A0A5D3DLD4_CUCMM|nr:pol protein [Cucumis melo var. makuwa]
MPPPPALSSSSSVAVRLATLPSPPVDFSVPSPPPSSAHATTSLRRQLRTNARESAAYLEIALFTQVDSLGMDSIKGHSQVSGKGFLTTGPRIEAGNVVAHMGIIHRHRCPDVLCIVVMLYVSDPSHVVDYEPLEIDENLSYTEQPVEVLVREVKMLRNREIPLVKVLWRNHRVEEATWEREDNMRARYSELFEE